MEIRKVDETTFAVIKPEKIIPEEVLETKTIRGVKTEIQELENYIQGSEDRCCAEIQRLTEQCEKNKQQEIAPMLEQLEDKKKQLVDAEKLGIKEEKLEEKLEIINEEV